VLVPRLRWEDGVIFLFKKPPQGCSVGRNIGNLQREKPSQKVPSLWGGYENRPHSFELWPAAWTSRFPVRALRRGRDHRRKHGFASPGAGGAGLYLNRLAYSPASVQLVSGDATPNFASTASTLRLRKIIATSARPTLAAGQIHEWWSTSCATWVVVRTDMVQSPEEEAKK